MRMHIDTHIYNTHTHTHQLVLGKMRRRPINPFDSYLFVCLTLPGCHLFSFISFPPSCCCVCVCPSICSLSHVEMLSDTVTPVCTLEPVSYEQSLTWNAILETHTLSDSSKTFSPLIHRVMGGERGNNSRSRHHAISPRKTLTWVSYLTFKEKVCDILNEKLN